MATMTQTRVDAIVASAVDERVELPGDLHLTAKAKEHCDILNQVTQSSTENTSNLSIPTWRRILTTIAMMVVILFIALDVNILGT